MPVKKAAERKRSAKTDPANVTEPPSPCINNLLELEPATIPAKAPVKPRKARGTKIVTKQQITSLANQTLTNVVLNLKCSMNDLREYNDRLSKMIINPLEYNSSAPPEVKFYDGSKPFGSLIAGNNLEQPAKQPDSYWRITKSPEKPNQETTEDYGDSRSHFSDAEDPKRGGVSPRNTYSNMSTQENPRQSTSEDYSDPRDAMRSHCALSANVPKFTEEYSNWAELSLNSAADDVNTKEINNKLKQLKIQLYKNALHSEKKSACFWCTYDFDNSPCYIPKYEMDGTIYGYGSFCRPECAVAYLMKESIDDSTKFDRYHLLNQIYSKVYECKKNIKPAPDPHFLLEKFYGNLTIQEYRKLLKTEHLLLVIDKPLTRILPELHEDTDDAFTKIYGIKGGAPAATSSNGNTAGVYKVKRQSEQPTGPTKASIIRSTFGLSN